MKENGNKPFSKDKFLKQFRKHLEALCKAKNILYDKNLRNAKGNLRIFDSFKFKNESAGRNADAADSSATSKQEKVATKTAYKDN
jgi:hypothetical protein